MTITFDYITSMLQLTVLTMGLDVTRAADFSLAVLSSVLFIVKDVNVDSYRHDSSYKIIIPELKGEKHHH